MRSLRSLTAAAALLLAAITARSFGDDGQDVIRLRAHDFSAMREAREAQGVEVPEVPLRDREVQALVLLQGGGTSSLDLRTDAAGNLEVPSAAVPPGSKVSFRIQGADGFPLYMIQAIDLATEPRPQTAPFISVAKTSPLGANMLMHIARVVDPDSQRPYVRLNTVAVVENYSASYWLGDPALPDRPILSLPLPDGFEVAGVEWAGKQPKFTTGRDADGRPVVHVSAAWMDPYSGKPERIRVVATGPFRKGEDIDLTFRTPFPVESYRLQLEQGKFAYDDSAPGDVRLTDAGVQPPLEGMNDVATAGFEGREIDVGRLVGARFTSGHRIDRRVWYTLGAIAFALVGAALLAKALGSAARGPAVVPANVVPAEDRIASLRSRQARGEITEFEMRARIAAIRREKVAKPSASTTLDDGAGAEIDRIEAAAATAHAAELRTMLRRLIELARESRRG